MPATSLRARTILYFAIMFGLLASVAWLQSLSVALAIFNLCLISAIMALGINMQWGYAGLFNLGSMGFAALGGLAVVLVAQSPVTEAWQAGGLLLAVSLLLVAVLVLAVVLVVRFAAPKWRNAALLLLLVCGYFLINFYYGPARAAIEAVDPALTGYLGGLGLPVLFAWPMGALFAAAAAWVIGKIALGLRADYLAIATLGISEIVVAVLKNEEWLSRGVKNVNGLPRPVPYEVDLQQSGWVTELAASWGVTVADISSWAVKLCYAGLFLSVLLIALILLERALNSPWGRMMRAIRDNEVAAGAMGKDVRARHLQVVVLGSALIGLAGAMLVTLDGQFTPTSYQPLRFTFIIMVMVIVGGSGNNLGSVLGGFLIWFVWIEAEPVGFWLLNHLSAVLDEQSGLRQHLLDAAPHMRPLAMGLILIAALKFAHRGLLPERAR